MSRSDSNQRLTYREKRERKAERLFEWAEKRESAAVSAFERSHELADMIPFGQPILVGHHSERGHQAHIKRIDSAMRQAVDNDHKAADMRSRAANIEAAAKQAIYSDDPDAIERLTEKIARLEAEREAVKQANASYRKAHRDELKAMTSTYARDRAMPFPSYVATNLTGNIGRLRKRLELLQRPPVDRIILARFDSECADCGAPLHRGDTIRYSKQAGARCTECK